MYSILSLVWGYACAFFPILYKLDIEQMVTLQCCCCLSYTASFSYLLIIDKFLSALIFSHMSSLSIISSVQPPNRTVRGQSCFYAWILSALVYKQSVQIWCVVWNCASCTYVQTVVKKLFYYFVSVFLSFLTIIKEERNCLLTNLFYVVDYLLECYAMAKLSD